MTTEEGAALAEERGAGFCELSSQTGENVAWPFVETVKQVVQSRELMAAVAAGRTPGTLPVGAADAGSSACSC